MPEGSAWVSCPPAAPGVGVVPPPCLTPAPGERAGPGEDVDATPVEIGDPTRTSPLGVPTTPRIASVKVEPGEVAPGLAVSRPGVGVEPRVGVGPGLAQAQTAATKVRAPASAVTGRIVRARREWASAGGGGG